MITNKNEPPIRAPLLLRQQLPAVMALRSACSRIKIWVFIKLPGWTHHNDRSTWYPLLYKPTRVFSYIETDFIEIARINILYLRTCPGIQICLHILLHRETAQLGPITKCMRIITSPSKCHQHLRFLSYHHSRPPYLSRLPCHSRLP